MVSSNASAAGEERWPGNGATLISLSVAALLGLYILLTSTTRLIPSLDLYDAKRILQFGLLLGLSLIPTANTRIRTQVAGLVAVTPPALRWCLAIAFAWGALSAAAHAESWLHAANSIADVTLPAVLVAAVYIVAACRQIAGVRFDRLAVGLMALTGIAVGVQELTGVLAAHDVGTTFDYWISLTYFGHPRFFNQVQTWVLPVLPALPLLFPKSRLAAVLCLLALMLNWFIVLMTGARGTFLAVVAATIAILFIVPAVRRDLLKWQLVGFLAGAAIFALVLLSFQPGNGEGAVPAELQTPPSAIGGDAQARAYIGDLPSDGNRFLSTSVGRPLLHSMGRTAMWERAARDALSNPLFGIGPMAYPCSQPGDLAHPHNFPLQVAAEWGLPAALALCIFVIMLLWRATRALRLNPEEIFESPRMAAFLAAGTLAALLHACASGVLIMPASQMSGLLVCGMLLGQLRTDRRSMPRQPARLSCVPAVALSVALLVLGGHELNTMQQRTDLMPPGIKHPRMWQNAFVCRFYTSQIPVRN